MFFSNCIFFFFNNSSTSFTTLEKIPFEAEFREPNSEFEFHLDHKVTEATTGVSISYNSGTDVTTFTLPYRLNASMSVVGRYLANGETSTFVDTQGNTKTLKPGQVVQTTNTKNGSTSTITANGDFRNSKLVEFSIDPNNNVVITPHIGGMTIEGQTKAYHWAINKFKGIK